MVLPLFVGRFETDGLRTTTLFIATSLYLFEEHLEKE